MHTILTDAQADFLRREKAALGDLRLKLAELGAAPEDLTVLQDAQLQLDELFLLVVAGEFNAGKSRLINALLGQPLLAEGVLPTTSAITLVRHGDPGAGNREPGAAVTVTAPADFLRALTIVDTPGTNAIVRRHEELTREFVPRSDLVLFVTSADRPFSESESEFLELIRDWGKKIVIVVNKIDILEDQAARQQVLDYVRQSAQARLGVTPEIFAASAKTALKAWNVDGTRDEQAWADSGFGALEDYIQRTLHAGERLRLKLDSPLGVAEHVVVRFGENTAHELTRLGDDIATAATVDQQVEVYAREVREELAPRLAQAELILRKLEARGLDFFDSTIRLTKIFDLARGDRVRAAFERDVLGDVPQQVQHQVQATIDWLIEKDLRQWQQVSAYLQRRQAQHAAQLIGQVPDALDARRRQLLDSVGESARQVLESYDREEEARRLAGEVEQAVAFTALAEGAAVVGGAAVVALLTAAFEPTGLAAASVVALLGVFIIPYKRTQAKQRFSDKVADTRVRLNSVLVTQFNAEAERALTRLRESVAPYTRFVRAERERLDRLQETVTSLRNDIAALHAEAQKL
jgi:GTP-binding protein EngB required for normal cell division